jgi:hypothetical protein
MLIHSSYSSEVGQKEYLQTVRYNGTPPAWDPPFASEITLPLVAPSHEVRFEALYSDNGKHRKFKHCQHYSRRFEWANGDTPVPFPYSIASGTAIGYYTTGAGGGAQPITGYDSSGPYNEFGPLGRHLNGVPKLYEVQPNGDFISHPADMTSLIERSLKNMLPGIKSELSLVNSFVELKDFGTIPGILKKLRAFGSGLFSPRPKMRRRDRTRFQDQIRRSFSRDLGLTFSEGLRGAANAYLQTQFNIGPLLQDISSIYTALTRTTSRINEMVARQGTPQRRHYTFKWWPVNLTPDDKSVDYFLTRGASDYYPPSGLTGGYNYLPIGLRMYRQCQLRKPVVFHAEIEYNYNFTRYQVEHAQLLGHLDALGVNLNPAIIWNAIPYSFIVDWILGVSRWLDSRKKLNLQPAINITQYLYSTKVERTTKLWFHSYQVGNSAQVPIRYLPELYETAYRRDVGIPEIGLLRANGLSSVEVSLGAALVITRASRPKQRTYQRA